MSQYPLKMFAVALGVFVGRMLMCLFFAGATVPALISPKGAVRSIVFVVVLESLFGAYFFWVTRNDPASFLRAQASGMPPTIMGMFLLLGFGCVLWWLQVETKVPAIARIGALLLVSGGLLMTLSRGPIVGGVVLLCWLMTSRLRRARRAVIVPSIVLIAALVISILPALGPKVSSRLTFGSQDYTASVVARERMATEAFEFIKSSPLFGIGFMRYPAMTTMEYTGTITCHNLYLQMWLEFGLFGLVTFLALCAPFVRDTLRFARQVQSPRAYIAATLTAFLVSQLVDYGFLYHKPLILFWLLVGLYFRLRSLSAVTPLIVKRLPRYDAPRHSADHVYPVHCSR
jgi:O-antigen ligase